MTIIRNPTNEEQRDFKPIGYKAFKTDREKFQEELRTEEQKATKKGVPFARHAARDDFDTFYDLKQKELKQRGFIEKNDPIKINWIKYSDLKSFEIVEEKEVYDEHATKRNPGLAVYEKAIVYRYIGYDNYTYTVMEGGNSAIKRALDKSRERTKPEIQTKPVQKPEEKVLAKTDA